LGKSIAFSTAKMLAEQIKRGEERRQIERVISIVICDNVGLTNDIEKNTLF
jgi:hypothetical protein